MRLASRTVEQVYNNPIKCLHISHIELSSTKALLQVPIGPNTTVNTPNKSTTYILSENTLASCLQ